MSQPSPFDPSKPVRYRNGTDAIRILCTDAPGRYPIILIDAAGIPGRRTATGKYHSESLSGLDLVNIPQRIQRRVGWLNVYADIACFHFDRCGADAMAKGAEPRLACIPVDIDCEEGEGL